MVFDFNIYVFESWVNYGFFYAFILGTVCVGECSFMANDSHSMFIVLMVAEGQYTVFTRLLYFFTGG